jgi:hypothetical protein
MFLNFNCRERKIEKNHVAFTMSEIMNEIIYFVASYIWRDLCKMISSRAINVNCRSSNTREA